ncbi:unnamed protein product [Effrenium voratum]|uniref:Uncharacterized protein n=1 Tax=Effrenium voratum TaxID=2562239 RepID=A0AA36IMT6_9DINO|nr:unnamed protein product [Effrenium voratum]
MCTPKKSGRLEVSAELQKVWQACGPGRKQLVNALIACNGDKEAFKKRVEHQLSKTRRNKTTVQAGFYTKDKMKKVLGFSPFDAQILRDLYQSHVKHYWVEEQVTGTFEVEESEAFHETSIAEGDGDTSLTLGGPAASSDPLDLPGSSMADSPEISEVEDEDGTESSAPRPSKNDEVKQELALEALVSSYRSHA